MGERYSLLTGERIQQRAIDSRQDAIRRSELAAEVRLREAAERERDQAIAEREAMKTRMEDALKVAGTLSTEAITKAMQTNIDALKTRCESVELKYADERKRAEDADKKCDALHKQLLDMVAKTSTMHIEKRFIDKPGAPEKQIIMPPPVAYKVRVAARDEFGGIKEWKLIPEKDARH